MKLFVTGAASPLGRRVCELLASHDLAALRHRAPVPGRAVIGSLERPETYADAAREADAVIHLAAQTRSRRREQYFRVNVDGTRALVAASRGHFIFVSTRAIGAAGGGYAASKARAESIVRAAALPWTIFRPAEIVGEREGIGALLRIARRWRVFPIPILPAPPALAPVDLESVAQAVARSVGDPRCHGRIYVLAGRPQTFSQLRPRGAFPIPVPLFALHAAAGALPGVAPDQVTRLLLPKEHESRRAAEELGFAPADIAGRLRG